MRRLKPGMDLLERADQELTPEIFRPHIGQIFSFESGDEGQSKPARAFDLELVEVNASGRRRTNGGIAKGIRAEPFALLFILHGPEPLGRGLHRLVHERFSPSELFLSRVVAPQRAGRDGPGAVYYEAVFG